MLIRIARGWEIPEREATPAAAVLSRRRFLGTLAAAGSGVLAGQNTSFGASLSPALATLDAKPNPRFAPDGPLTDAATAARYNNFYEFTQEKDVWRHVEKYQPKPWSLEVTGLVQNPKTWDLDALHRLPLEERVYRHRCVEAWFMDVPWVGVPLRKILDASQPLAKARYVRFVSLLRKDQMPGQKAAWYSWPYYEALTLAEAMNELTLATVGIFGHELPKQHGAPFRVVVPWKYGYKGPKAVVRIELTDAKPRTFWNDLYPGEYSFDSNVNPSLPHPRWSQATERSIDGRGRRPTRLYNGYGEWVGHLYKP